VIQVIVDPQAGPCQVVAEGDLVHCTGRGDVLIAIGEEETVEQVPTEQLTDNGCNYTINVPYVVRRPFFVIRTTEENALSRAQDMISDLREALAKARLEASEQTKSLVLCTEKNERLEQQLVSHQKKLEQAEATRSDLESQLAEATRALKLIRRAIGELQLAKVLNGLVENE
jgi:hypothetical protein